MQAVRSPRTLARASQHHTPLTILESTALALVGLGFTWLLVAVVNLVAIARGL